MRRLRFRAMRERAVCHLPLRGWFNVCFFFPFVVGTMLTGLVHHSCAALPLVNSAGTSITCTTSADRDARIAATGAGSIQRRHQHRKQSKGGKGNNRKGGNGNGNGGKGGITQVASSTSAVSASAVSTASTSAAAVSVPSDSNDRYSWLYE